MANFYGPTPPTPRTPPTPPTPKFYGPTLTTPLRNPRHPRYLSLFELKDNDTIDMSAIIEKLQDMPRNRHFLISEAEKIAGLLLLSQATNTGSEGIFSALKRVKTYLR